MTDLLRGRAGPAAPRGDGGRVDLPAAGAGPGRRRRRRPTRTTAWSCCSCAATPSLAPAAQIALTLRAVGGLTTAEIARAFLVLRGDDDPADHPGEADRPGQRRALLDALGDAAYPERLGVVLHVLYLIFNEGYATTAGENLQRSDLTAEAIRLTRMVHREPARTTTRSPACWR